MILNLRHISNKSVKTGRKLLVRNLLELHSLLVSCEKTVEKTERLASLADYTLETVARVQNKSIVFRSLLSCSWLSEKKKKH